MPLNPGVRIGHYEVFGALGAGGMGEVYRARDTKLGRDVALKVLPDSVVSDSDRVARFAREAHVLASLSHPNIAAIYGLEDAGNVRALVLELVEGPTLAEHLASSGALSLHDALPIARQIADALEAAHERGIVHRDLKPANVKVMANGTVKVLDFGLAKALTDGRTGSDPSVSPTLTMTATQLGVILGTAAYMAPEQARGKDVDKRADIWAFGCVLYEMLAGSRAFGSDEVSDTLAFVITKDPDWKALPSTMPAPIRKLLRRCLEKDRRKRLADIADARFEIEEALAETDTGLARSPNLAGTPAASNSLNRLKPAIPWAIASLAIVASGTLLALWAPSRTGPAFAPVHVSVELGAEVSLASTAGDALALSPDGNVLAFVGQKTVGGSPQLYVRRLGELQAVALAGTDGAAHPFFSPDGQWIAFFADRQLKKIQVSGGTAVALCDAPRPRGGSWAEDDTIVFQPDQRGPLQRVSSGGGELSPVTTLGEGEVAQRFPQVLPGGQAVLFTGHAGVSDFDNANIVVQSFATGARKVLRGGGYHARYVSIGYLLYIHEGTLFADSFDLNRLEPGGHPVPVLEGVYSTSNAPSLGMAGSSQFAVSAAGTLAYLPGRFQGDNAPIDWMDRSGKTTPLRALATNWSNPNFAPDGHRLAVDIQDDKQLDVWIYDWERDTLSRLTLDAADDSMPVWTPDGRRITFESTRASSMRNLYWQRADGSGEVQRLTESTNPQHADSWHPSGKFLVLNETHPQTGDDLLILPIEGDEDAGWKPGQPTVFLNSGFHERAAMFSPDGRWLAYSSNESGQFEVYVRPFPGPGPKVLVSSGSGGDLTPIPTWSRTRRELFYDAPDQRLMVVSYTVEGDSFRADKPRLWSETPFVRRPRQKSFDLHPDGNRFAISRAAETDTSARQSNVVFVFHFFNELRRRVRASQ